jgi:hypothetical protein
VNEQQWPHPHDDWSCDECGIPYDSETQALDCAWWDHLEGAAAPGVLTDRSAA